MYNTDRKRQKPLSPIPSVRQKGDDIMKIQFATKQMTVPERVYSHAEHRINELDPFFRGTPEAAVVFGAEDGKAVVELTIFAGSTIFRVVEKTSDMMVSIDAAVSSVRRQLRENYARLPKEVNADAFEKETDEVTFIPELNRFDAPAYQVVRLKNFSFRNEEKDGAFSVVYRRNDGGYGVLVDAD